MHDEATNVELYAAYAQIFSKARGWEMFRCHARIETLLATETELLFHGQTSEIAFPRAIVK